MYPINVLQLLKELNDKDICYLHWKSNEHLDEGLSGKTDLDILIAEEKYDLFVECLINNNYIKVVSMVWQQYPYVEDWIGYCNETGVQTHIHLHIRLITGKPYVKEQYLPFSEMMFNSKRYVFPGVYITDPNLEVIVLLIRTVIKQSSIIPIANNKYYSFGKNAKTEFEYLKKTLEVEAVRKYATLIFPDNSELLISIIFEKCSNKRMLRLKRLVIDMFEKDRRYGYMYSCLLSSIRYYYIKIRAYLGIPLCTKKAIASHKGLIVAFLGVDGSGKTTIAKRITKDFGWKIDFRYFYLGSGDGSRSILTRVLRRYTVLKRAKRFSNEFHDSADKQTSLPNLYRGPKGFKLLISNIVTVSNAKAKLLACQEMNDLRNKGGIAITDRYPQLQFSGINDGVHILDVGVGFLSRINRMLQKREMNLISEACRYSPDVVIKLDIPFDVSRARKHDSTDESIKQKINIIKSLNYVGANEYVVDNTGELEKTILEVKKIIWKEMKEAK
ncbi:MAG: hypothetical protein IKO16_09350 [Lachnospiraceae bacterium]|nr:hypothetical protein [Lachnospiraceae bacterium]